MLSDEDNDLAASLTYEHEHLQGLHADHAEVECNYCKQLFDSTHDEAVQEAIERGLAIL